MAVRSPWWCLCIDQTILWSTAENLFTNDPCGWHVFWNSAAGEINRTFWQLICNPLKLSSPLSYWNNNRPWESDRHKGWGRRWEVGNFASHLLTVKHAIITVCCPLVYLPPEDSGPVLVTIGPDDQSMCPLSDVIYIIRMSLLCCPLTAYDQSFPAQTQNSPLTKHCNVLDCLLRRLKILIGRIEASLTLRRGTQWKQTVVDTPNISLWSWPYIIYSHLYHQNCFHKTVNN